MKAFNEYKSYEEFKRDSYLYTKTIMFPKLIECKQKGNWEEFINIAISHYEVMPEAFSFFEEIPDNMKYDFAIKAYTHHGDSIPSVRKAVRVARKYGVPVLPPEIASKDVITVYRSGEEPINKAKYRISWTTDKEVADFFMYTYRNRRANHIYKAQIKTKDIIAYTDDRNEREVMQYRKVFNIEDITPEN